MILPWHIVRLWVLISLAALLAGVLLAPGPTLAEEELHHAGLVVRDAEGRMTYAWVPFAEEEIDGIDLLRRSGIPVVTVGFGALGDGVCSIAGQGCGVAECRRKIRSIPPSGRGSLSAPVAAGSRTAMYSAGAGRLATPPCRRCRRRRSPVV